MVCVDCLLDLEYRVDALGWNDLLSFIVEDEGGVLSVEHNDIDLFAEPVLAIDDMGCVYLITLRQVRLEEL